MVIKLQLWDTSGAEKYAAITKTHYRGAQGAILVYDVTDEESFRNLDKWIDEIDQKADEFWKIMIIPNKCDITNKEPRKRQISTKAVDEFAKKRGILYYGEWSAFQNINVRTSIRNLVQEIYEKQLELIDKGIRKRESLKISIEQHDKKKEKNWWL